MTPLTPLQVDELLARAGANARVYLVGAGGCGMSGLGHLLLDLGCAVAGSDLVENDEIRQLRARGAQIFQGHAVEPMQEHRPTLVVYSSAIRASNPELTAACASGIPLVHRATLLAALMRRQRGVCVAGMHGKTTTSALLAYALERLEARPSFAVGWLAPQLSPHARFASPAGDARPLFVVEADESDGTLTEFQPEHAIVLNVDAEHLDYYANVETVCRAFGQFGEQVVGELVFCADDARLGELFAHHPRSVSYGFNPLATYRVEIPAGPSPGAAGETRFAVWHQGARLGEFTTLLLGRQNISNATAVVALLHRLGFGEDAIAGAVRSFRGAARRQEELFRDARFRVFDDYGHHPVEIVATLAAFRALAPRRLLVAFQPHRYTRTQLLLAEFAESFRAADRLWLMEIYPASEPAIPGVTSEMLAEAIRAQGLPAEVVASAADLCGRVRAALEPGDLLVFLGAGADITVAARQLADQLRAETPLIQESWHAELVARLGPDTVLRRDEPLAKRTTLRVGGPAEFYVEPASEADLATVLRWCRERSLPFCLLGRGSNLLIRDRGVRGVVISMAHPNFGGVQIVGETLHASCGARLKAIAAAARQHGLAGLEFLEGIPGSLGGSLRMNAGAMGSWLFDVVECVRFMDFEGRVQESPVTEVAVEYRGCPLFRDHIALGAVLKGVPASPESVAARADLFNRKRWESQPKEPSAGCIFKNPETIPAGRLIDELGLKGARCGGARVSEVHGNFIVNDGAATARDVLELIEVIRARARAERGIELETEVEIWGEG